MKAPFSRKKKPLREDADMIKKKEFPRFSNDFKGVVVILKGCIRSTEENYTLIKYLEEEGTITENSIGEVTTKYLPNGAKVKNFNLSDSEITILLGEKESIISINDQIK